MFCDQHTLGSGAAHLKVSKAKCAVVLDTADFNLIRTADDMPVGLFMHILTHGEILAIYNY